MFFEISSPELNNKYKNYIPISYSNNEILLESYNKYCFDPQYESYNFITRSLNSIEYAPIPDFCNKIYSQNFEIIYNDIIIKNNDKSSISIDGIIISFDEPLYYIVKKSDNYCIICTNYQINKFKYYILDVSTKKIIKIISCISTDMIYYYDNNNESICNLDGSIIINNIGYIFNKFIFCHNIKFIYNKLLILYIKDKESKCPSQFQQTNYKINIYSPWNRLLSYRFIDTCIYNSMILALICNNINKIRDSKIFIPKYVLLYIFDLFY